MTIDPVKIPQNVYVEDRIFGPISLRQIIICLLTGGVSYLLFSSLAAMGQTSIFAKAIALMPFLLGTAFAFVKVNGITLTRFCLLMIERADKPRTRVWSPRRGIIISIGTASVKSTEEIAKETRLEAEKRREDEKRKRIAELSNLLDNAPSSSVQTQDLVEQKQAQMESSTLPVDKSRVHAEPLSSDTTTDIARPEHTATPVVRDISPASP
jgi:hypothetical protein